MVEPACAVYFAVLRPRAFLRNLVYLRKRRGARTLFDLLALSGLGDVGLGLLRLAQAVVGRRPLHRGLAIEPFEAWGAWADDIWAAAAGRYALIGDRSAAALAALYPAGHPQMRKVRIAVDGRSVGWAVFSAAQVREHSYFGHMRLGALIDMLAAPEDAHAIISGALIATRAAQADVLVVNHSAAAWSEACVQRGSAGRTDELILVFGAGTAPTLRAAGSRRRGFFL